MRIASTIEYTRRADPRWQAELGRIAPPGLGLSWLLLRWLPGDPWKPLERWVVYHMYPPGFVPLVAQDGLAGAHPRSSGHYCGDGWCHCPRKTGDWGELIPKPEAWVGGPPSAWCTSRETWELYHETGCFGRILWVIQGGRGGHLFELSQAQQKIAEAQQLPTEPPAIGVLPYADVDARVVRGLVAWDRLRSYRFAKCFKRRASGEFDAEDAALLQEANRLMGVWLEQQLGGSGDELRFWLRRAPEIPRPRDWHPDESRPLDGEAIDRAFLATA